MSLRNRIWSVAMLLGAAAGGAGQTATAPAGPVQPPALTALNDAFRAAYDAAKKRVLGEARPTLVVNGDNFSLIREGGRLEANVGTPIYDPVKTIAHVPLAIYVTLTPGDGAIDNDRAKTLTGLRDLVPPAIDGLDQVKLPAASLARQKRIVKESVAFLDDAVAKRSFTRAGLRAFTRRMAPLVLENVTEATRAQLDATHAQMKKWRNELSAEEWSRLHVVIIGPHMPRQDLVVTQYFLRLLHERTEGDRVVYAESLWQEPQALDLLGTHLLDGGVGDAFFGEYLRMHRDLLGDAAKQYLPKLMEK